MQVYEEECDEALWTDDEMQAGVVDRMYGTSPARASGCLKSSGMAGGTITISSMGDNGVESLYGVIYPPQVAKPAKAVRYFSRALS